MPLAGVPQPQEAWSNPQLAVFPPAVNPHPLPLADVGLGQRNTFLSRYPLLLPNQGAPALDVMDIYPTGVTSPACQDRPASFVSRALLLARPLPPAAASPLALLPFCLWTWGQECQGDSPSSFPAQPLGTRGQPGPSSGLSALGPQRPIQRLCLLTTFRASCPICSQQVCHPHCCLLLPT